MNILVVGATGMTGGSLVEQLLDKGHHVHGVVRSPGKFSSRVLQHPNMKVTEASVLDLTDEEMTAHAKGCNAVVSCLGHDVSFKGMFGNPRKLCTEATQRLCQAIEKNNHSVPVKFILMNTVGVRNPDRGEIRTWYERILLGLLRHTVPPHRDNETASEYLHSKVGKNNRYIEWCCVRPDSLINAEVSLYDIEESPVTGIFSGRPTSRSNVAHFMCELIGNVKLWNRWNLKMPVIMNSNR